MNERGTLKGSIVRRWPVILALALAAAALIAATVPIVRDLATPRPRVVHFGTPEVGGRFTLVDQNGFTVTERDFFGKPLIVTFGHRADTDQTRLLLRVLFQTLETLGRSADEIVPVFITIDPQRDTPDALKPFADAVSSRLVALSGPPDAVSATIKTYRVWVARFPDKDAPEGERIEYQPLYFVMDRAGRYVGHVDFTPSPRQLAEELRPLLAIARSKH